MTKGRNHDRHLFPADFTANELPTKRWMKLIRPKMRLRVRVQRRHFVSSTINVHDQNSDGTNVSSVHWNESIDLSSIADDDALEVNVERRFLLRYKCIRRTRSVRISEVRNSDTTGLCTLPLYDGEYSAEELGREDKIKMGEIRFRLTVDVGRDQTTPPNRKPTEANTDHEGSRLEQRYPRA
jgi:hypothetical protein